MTYKFNFCRPGSRNFETREVIGHQLDDKRDKMVLYFENQGLEEVAEWSKCSLALGTDWIEARALYAANAAAAEKTAKAAMSIVPNAPLAMTEK